MSKAKIFGRFWYDFIIGDDWRIAFGVAVLIGLGYVAMHHGANLWWGLPCAITALLALSLHRETRRAYNQRA